MSTPLHDSVAIHLLTSLVAPRLPASTADAPPEADLLASLAEAFGPAPAAPAPTLGELARAALAVFTEDPRNREALDALAESTPPTFGPGPVETIAVLTAAIAVLQTEVTFERTPAGTWKAKILPREASDALLGNLAHAVMRALGGLR